MCGVFPAGCVLPPARPARGAGGSWWACGWAGGGGSGEPPRSPRRFDLLLGMEAVPWLSERNAAAKAIPQDEISLQWVIPASFEGGCIVFFFPTESFIPGVRKVQNDFPPLALRASLILQLPLLQICCSSSPLPLRFSQEGVGKERGSGLGQLFSEPVHGQGEMPSCFKLRSPEAASFGLWGFRLNCLLSSGLSAWGGGDGAHRNCR